MLIGALAAVACGGDAVVGVRDRPRHEVVVRGWYTPTAYRSPRRLVFDTFVNGTHPLLPWLAFVSAGMVIGRYLPLRRALRAPLAALGVALVAGIVPGQIPVRGHPLAGAPAGNRSVQPQPQLHGVRARVVAGCLLHHRMDRQRNDATNAVTRSLAAAGRTTLTIYIAARVWCSTRLVTRWHLIGPAGLDVALVFAGTFWLVAILAAVWWQRHFGIGPAEWIYRRFGGGSMPPEATAPR